MSATRTEVSSVLVSVMPTGVMKTVAFMPASAIQNVSQAVSDQPTQIARNVSATHIVMNITDVYAMSSGLDQTAASTWDLVTLHVTVVMDHLKTQRIPKMWEFAMNA